MTTPMSTVVAPLVHQQPNVNTGTNNFSRNLRTPTSNLCRVAFHATALIVGIISITTAVLFCQGALLACLIPSVLTTVLGAVLLVVDVVKAMQGERLQRLAKTVSCAASVISVAGLAATLTTMLLLTSRGILSTQAPFITFNVASFVLAFTPLMESIQEIRDACLSTLDQIPPAPRHRPSFSYFREDDFGIRDPRRPFSRMSSPTRSLTPVSGMIRLRSGSEGSLSSLELRNLFGSSSDDESSVDDDRYDPSPVSTNGLHFTVFLPQKHEQLVEDERSTPSPVSSSAIHYGPYNLFEGPLIAPWGTIPVITHPEGTPGETRPVNPLSKVLNAQDTGSSTDQQQQQEDSSTEYDDSEKKDTDQEKDEKSKQQQDQQHSENDPDWI